MAATNLLTLIDDIASLLDDIALMTKTAAHKTVGIVSDDLALNAEQVSGVRAEREIPVVLAVAKGSLINKVILVPLAILISAFANYLITPLLLVGGLYLCFEGIEKIFEKLFHKNHEEAKAAIIQDTEAYEREKIKGAIRTDFVLSTEIIVITLGAVASASITTQIAVLSIIALTITVGIYGIVAGIVKLDDLGLFLTKKASRILQKVGRGLLLAAPKLMKLISVIGTVAMFLVGGNIIIHALPFLHIVDFHTLTLNPILLMLLPKVFEIIIGMLAGALLFPIVFGIAKLLPRKDAAKN